MLEWMASNRKAVETSIFIAKILAWIASFGIPAWAAKASGWLNSYSPFSWVAAGFSGVLILALVLFFYSLGRRYLSYAKLVDLKTLTVKTVNPLDHSYGSTVLRLQDVQDPVQPHIQAKTFDRCTILGPVVVTISGGTAFLHCELINCDHVAINNDARVQTALNLDGCNFNRCKLVGITFLIPVAAIQIIPPGANWLNARAVPTEAMSPLPGTNPSAPAGSGVPPSNSSTAGQA